MRRKEYIRPEAETLTTDIEEAVLAASDPAKITGEDEPGGSGNKYEEGDGDDAAARKHNLWDSFFED